MAGSGERPIVAGAADDSGGPDDPRGRSDKFVVHKGDVTIKPPPDDADGRSLAAPSR